MKTGAAVGYTHMLQYNVVMMVSSGLQISKMPTPSHVTDPVILAVKQAMNPGGISVKIATVPGAKSYLYQITLDPVTEASEWMTFGSSRTQYEFTGLEQGKKYWICVVAVGTTRRLLAKKYPYLYRSVLWPMLHNYPQLMCLKSPRFITGAFLFANILKK